MHQSDIKVVHLRLGAWKHLENPSGPRTVFSLPGSISWILLWRCRAAEETSSALRPSYGRILNVIHYVSCISYISYNVILCEIYLSICIYIYNNNIYIYILYYIYIIYIIYIYIILHVCIIYIYMHAIHLRIPSLAKLAPEAWMWQWSRVDTADIRKLHKHPPNTHQTPTELSNFSRTCRDL